MSEHCGVRMTASLVGAFLFLVAPVVFAQATQPKVDAANTALEEWWSAVRARKLDSLGDVALVVSRSEKVPELAGRIEKWYQAKDQPAFDRAMLGFLMARLGTHQHLHVGAKSKQPPTPEKVVEWYLAGLGHAVKVGDEPIARSHLARTLPVLVFAMSRVAEDLKNAQSAAAQFKQYLPALLALASGPERRDLQEALNECGEALHALSRYAGDRQKIQELLKLYVAAYNSKDADGLASVFGVDAAKLNARGVENIISASRWTIADLKVLGIAVHEKTALIDLVIEYADKSGKAGEGAKADFRALKSADGAWHLED